MNHFRSLSLLGILFLSLAGSAFAADAERGFITVESSVIDNGSIPRGAQRVPMLQMIFEASCAADAVIESVTITHQGLGERSDILRVYGLDGVDRLTRSLAFSSDEGIAVLRFRSLVVPACGKKVIIIAADFSSTAAQGGQHRAVLQSSSDISSSNSDVTTKLVISPVSSRTVGPSQGTINVSYPNLNRTVRYGTKQTILRLRLEADSFDSHILSSITFTNQGSATDNDLQNIYLQSSRGERVTKVVKSLQGDHVTLTFDPPYLLQKNEEKLFELKADVRASRRRTLNFHIEEPSDIAATVKRGRK